MGKFLLGLPFLIMAVASPSAKAQDATLLDARYCGLGVQGAVSDYARVSPNLAQIFNNQALKTIINNKLFEQTKASTPGINLKSKQEGSAAIGLSHVLTTESIEAPRFVDPRDGKTYFSVSYSFGINTVIFDTNSRQIQAIIPSIVVYNEVRSTAPDATAKASAFKGIFDGIGGADTAMSQWINTMSSLQIRADERTSFRVEPIVLSDEVHGLVAGFSNGGAQSPARFIKKLTEQYEALIASSLGKPVVPVAINSDGTISNGNQYIASIPDCLGETGALTLPVPTYKIRLTFEKASQASFQHQIPGEQNSETAAPYQTEFAYGARYRTELLQHDDIAGDKSLDTRTFKFARSIRVTGAREVDPYENFSKLTANFMGELLQAYASPKKDWVKEHVSASVTDKKQRDAGKIVKDWKTLFQGTLKIKPILKDTNNEK